MKALLLAFALLAGSAAAEPAPVPDSAAVRDWFRMSELDAGSSVRSRLKAGQDPNVLNERGQRALHWALMNDSGKALQALLEDPRTDPNSLNATGEKPVWLAAIRGRLDWVQALIQRGASLERGPQAPEARAWTILHYAATAPNLKVLSWLLQERCCDLNAGSTNGSTPLMLALGYGSLDAADLLIKAGADIERRNDLGLSAWDFGVRSGREDAIRRMKLLPAPTPAVAVPLSEKP
jgi:ankyrin repeat protein